jgi:hypothetical protein
MDPVTLIMTALAAGVTTGAQDAVKDAYDALKAVLVRRLRTHPADQGPSVASPVISPIAVLEAHEVKPGSWEAPLRDALIASGADKDSNILEVASRLLRLVDPDGAAGGKYHIDLRGAQGVQVGDHGQMTVSFHVGPRDGAMPGAAE